MNSNDSATTPVILVIDDDPAVTAVYMAIAEELGCQAISAKNGLQALEIVRQRDCIDVILLDLEMPVMNGLRFYIEYVGLGKRAQSKIIMTSSHSFAEDITKALQLFAHSPKDASIDKLRDALLQALGRKV